MQVPHIGADQLRAALSPGDAVDAITDLIVAGFDPATDLVRTAAATAHGQFLLMPSEAGDFAGLKVVTIAPENPSSGLPRIQGIYLLFDAATLTLVATLDGAALTTLRTPAVSFAAVRPALRRIVEPIRVAVFGSGPQAIGHLDMLEAVTDQPIDSVVFIVRENARVEQAVRGRGSVTQLDSAEAHAALANAHIVICATTAREPLFSASAITRDAIVIAVGSHEPDARELEGALLGRATVIVEDLGTALREAGDLIMAINEGELDPTALIPLKELLTGETPLPSDRPVVFKSVGMSWQDLAIAAAVLQRTNTNRDRDQHES